jgi:transitional endoplasmic reticulum ATPase
MNSNNIVQIEEELQINSPILVQEHVKLYARLPIDCKYSLHLKNFEHILIKKTHEGSVKCCPALVQFSEYVNPGTIDISHDILLTLNANPGEFITIQAIKNIAPANIVYFYSKKPIEQKKENLLPYLLHKPIMKNTIVFDKKNKLIVANFRYVGKTPDPLVVYITRNTEFTFIEHHYSDVEINFESIGGLKEELAKLREVLELPINHRDLFEKMHLRPPRGILLYGPPGTGKTLLAKAIANAVSANFYVINAPSIATKYYGESENKLRSIFEKASQNPPAVIFIDEIDAIASKRMAAVEVDKRVCAQLLVLMDGIDSNKKTIVIAATNMPDELDPALRRGGRFDIELEIKPPNIEGRKEILDILLKESITKDLDLDKLSQITNGYVGADLDAVVRHAGVLAIRDHIDAGKPLGITMDHLYESLKRVEPSTMREFKVEKPKVNLEEVIGLDEEIDLILSHLSVPAKRLAEFRKRNLKQINGILLYGAPGTGKTLLAKAIAKKLNYNLILVKGPELYKKYVGETEETIRNIFKKARIAAPTLIILDEIDSLIAGRDSDTISRINSANVNVLGQFLSELNGLSQLDEVVLIGTTNRPDILDPALIRAGRFDLKIEIKKPNVNVLKEMFRTHCKIQKIDVGEQELDDFAYSTFAHKMTGANIASIFRSAFLTAIRDPENKSVDEVTIKSIHLRTAIDKYISDLVYRFTNFKDDAEYYY